jgi:hypothetical protein
MIVVLNRTPSLLQFSNLILSFDKFKLPTTDKMKALAAVAIFVLLAFLVVIFPATAKLESTETAALAGSDRLEIHRDICDCSRQVWPTFDRSCLRNGTAIKWRVIPLIVSDRN